MNEATPAAELTWKTIVGFGIPIALILIVAYFVFKSLRNKYSKK